MRPGRVDRRIYLGNASAAVAAALADRFFPGETRVAAALASVVASSPANAAPREAARPGAAKRSQRSDNDDKPQSRRLGVPAAALHAESTVSPATLVGHLMQHRGDPESAAAHAKCVLNATRLRAIARAG
jgi:mitochondrial chaperone BCS1